MRLWMLALTILPFTAVAGEVCIAAGMGQKEAVALIKEHGGFDIGPGLEMVTPDGGPVTGICWEFRDYDAIIELSVKDGEVTGLSYWTKKDFTKNKSHRAESEQRITSLRLDLEKKTVSIEK